MALLVQKVPCREDTDPTVSPQLQKVLVSCHEMLGPPGYGTLQEFIIFRVPPNGSKTLSHPDCFNEGQQLFFDQSSDLLVAEAELLVGKDPKVLLKDRSGEEDSDALGLPQGDESRSGTGK